VGSKGGKIYRFLRVPQATQEMHLLKSLEYTHFKPSERKPDILQNQYELFTAL
jgi:hypothetical protein